MEFLLENKAKKAQKCGLFCLMLISSLSHASNHKVDGQTYPIPSELSMEDLSIRLSQDVINQLAEKSKLIKAPKSGFWPLRTDVMKVCRNSKSKSYDIEDLVVPLFVVGDDSVSYRWMRAYKKTLNRINAVGLIVSVQNHASFRKIKNTVGNLKLYPVEGDALSRFFDIKCYPVLISGRGIEQ